MTVKAGRPSCIALVPARAGSKRVPGKNIREFFGHPMLAYTLAAAQDSDAFDAILVSTDSPLIADIARHYGAEAPFLRPASMAGDLSPDIEWIEFTLNMLEQQGRRYDAFSILRPTNPFRLPETIRRAWDVFCSQAGIDSLRAVEKCAQHPGKMWVIRGATSPRMFPLLPFGPKDCPWHSTPYQGLPEIYVQNASLEIARTSVIREGRTIAGETVVPFISEGYEGFDINQPEDVPVAEELVRSGKAKLPRIARPPYRLAA
jgi:CMP-N,N'-diacetyllegionaminic acid synthase